MGELQARPQVTAPSRIYYAGEHLIEKVSIARFLLGACSSSPSRRASTAFSPKLVSAFCSRSTGVIAHLPWPDSRTPQASETPPPEPSPACAPEFSRRCDRCLAECPDDAPAR